MIEIELNGWSNGVNVGSLEPPNEEYPEQYDIAAWDWFLPTLTDGIQRGLWDPTDNTFKFYDRTVLPPVLYGYSYPFGENVVDCGFLIEWSGDYVIWWSDLAGNVTVVYYDYDLETPDYVFNTFSGKNPRCAHVTTNANIGLQTRDTFNCILVYQRGTKLLYRNYNEKFLTEHEIPWNGTPVILDRVGVETTTGKFTVRLKQQHGVLLRVGTKLLGIDDNYVGYTEGVLT